LASINGVTHVEALTPHQFRILHTADKNPRDELLALAAQHDWQLEQLTPLQNRLEDVFVKITGEENLNVGASPARDSSLISRPKLTPRESATTDSGANK
jgi:hypothetical protein